MQSICVMRQLYKALDQYETEFEAIHGVCLNEAMALCSLSQTGGEEKTATEIAELTGMTPSHTSKVIKSIEAKGLIMRSLGKKDKRQMYFSLTEQGGKTLSSISCKNIEIPEILRPVFEKVCPDKE